MILLAAGAWGLLTLPRAPAVVGGAVPEEAFDPELLAFLADYRLPGRLIAPVGLLVRLALPLAFVVTKPGRRVLDRLAGPRDHSPARAALVAVVMLGVADLVLAPINFWFGHVRETRFGFRTAGPLDWVRDFAIAVGIQLMIVAVGAALVAWGIRRWPTDWHWRAMAGGALLTLLGSMVWPLLVTPLFNATAPLPEGELRDRIEALVVVAGFDASLPIEVLDTSRRSTRVNAFVLGIGPTMRVQVNDNLLAENEDQTVAILAHELVHARNVDALRATVLGAAVLLPALLLIRRFVDDDRVNHLVASRSASDPRLVAAGIALLVVLEFVVTPIGLALSREVEAAADQGALELGADPDAQVALHRRFVIEEFSSPDRPAWVEIFFATHPSSVERIRRAAAFAS